MTPKFTGLTGNILFVVALALALRYGTATGKIINAFFNGGTKFVKALQLR